MDLISISKTTGAVALLIAVAAMPFGLLAGAQGDLDAAAGFAFTAGVGLFVGGALLIITHGRRGRGGVREAVAFAVLGWTIAPALAAPPFIAAAGGVLQGYADALSAASTTGVAPFFAAEAAEGGGRASGPLIAWWNLLQWAGGAATVMTALIVLASINVSGAGLHRSPLFTLEPDRLFERFEPVGRAVLAVYALGTAAAFILIWAAGAPLGEAATMALAGVSTGGLLLPNGGTSLETASPLVAGAGCLALLFGAFNFALHYDALRGRGARVYLADAEARALAVFFALAVIATIFATRAVGFDEVARAGASGIALASTSAWNFGSFHGLSHLAPLALALVIVGGSPASTAGGVKLMRIVLLTRQAVSELDRLAMPSSVRELKFRGKTLPSDAVMSMLAYVVAYAVGLGGLIVAFGGAGAEFPVAAAAAAAALTNAGPALALVEGPEAAGALLSTTSGLSIFCAGMVLGRLEVFAVFALLTPSFWRG
ncbi:MAG: potassium transporter TrkG [Maricaulaceae bacterium]|jgi:trk system potassium uptake protein TrkH